MANSDYGNSDNYCPIVPGQILTFRSIKDELDVRYAKRMAETGISKKPITDIVLHFESIGGCEKSIDDMLD
jgi:hypothetical protein